MGVWFNSISKRIHEKIPLLVTYAQTIFAKTHTEITIVDDATILHPELPPDVFSWWFVKQETILYSLVFVIFYCEGAHWGRGSLRNLSVSKGRVIPHDKGLPWIKVTVLYYLEVSISNPVQNWCLTCLTFKFFCFG